MRGRPKVEPGSQSLGNEGDVTLPMHTGGVPEDTCPAIGGPGQASWGEGAGRELQVWAVRGENTYGASLHAEGG